LIEFIIQLLRALFGFKDRDNTLPKPEPEPEHYTREQFIEAVKELSEDPIWRARILKDTLNIIKRDFTATPKWVEHELITSQWMNRLFGCGITISFGDGIHALPKDDWLKLIDTLQQDIVEYVKSFTDCDNFATFFKGFADYIVGKPVVIYATGAVFKPMEQYGVKTCRCKYDFLIGGHGWNMICTTEPIEVEKVGTTTKIKYDFTVYNYEPQNDKLGDRFMAEDRCYQLGGGLPIIYGYATK